MRDTRHYWLDVDYSPRLAYGRRSWDCGLSRGVVVMVMVVVMSSRISWGSSVEVGRTMKRTQSGGLFICFVAVMVVTRNFVSTVTCTDMR